MRADHTQAHTQNCTETLVLRGHIFSGANQKLPRKLKPQKSLTKSDGFMGRKIKNVDRKVKKTKDENREMKIWKRRAKYEKAR